MEYSRLYLIFDIPQAQADLPALRATFEAVLAGGARMIQLRAKQLSGEDFREVAEELVPLANSAGAQVFINTRAAIAHELGVAGIHRPARGPAVAELKEGGLRVGVSTHSLGEALAAEKEGADFVTFSPIFESASKPGCGPALGLERLGDLCATLSIPVYALAGVTPENAQDCREVGAFGVAVMGGILSAQDPSEATRRYLEILGAP